MEQLHGSHTDVEMLVLPGAVAQDQLPRLASDVRVRREGRQIPSTDPVIRLRLDKYWVRVNYVPCHRHRLTHVPCRAGIRARNRRADNITLLQRPLKGDGVDGRE